MKMKKTMLAVGVGVVLGALVVACGAELNPNTQGQIHSALEARREAFKACYETALDKDRNVQGGMGLRLDINEETGQVTDSAIETSEITDTQMQTCVANAASDITLPEPPGVPVEGHYDIDFGFE